MKESEALRLITRLAAAFPRDRIPEASLKLYAEMFLGRRQEVLAAAVEQLAKTERHFPPIATIREEYDRHWTPEHAELPEPELTEEEKQENLVRVRELLDSVLAGKSLDNAGDAGREETTDREHSDAS